MLSSLRSLRDETRRVSFWIYPPKHVNLPVNDTLAVEVLQRQEHFTRIELGLSKRELLLLDVQHQITSADVFHDEIDTSFRLETRVKFEQEWVTFLGGGQEDTLFGLGTVKTEYESSTNELRALFRHIPFNFIVLDDELLLQNLDSPQLLRLLLLGEHDLSEITLTQHGQKVKVVQTDFTHASWLLGGSHSLLNGSGCLRDLLHGRCHRFYHGLSNKVR